MAHFKRRAAFIDGALILIVASLGVGAGWTWGRDYKPPVTPPAVVAPPPMRPVSHPRCFSPNTEVVGHFLLCPDTNPREGRA